MSRQSTADANERLNPFAESYVGQEEHRRRVEAEHGAFQKFGTPNKAAAQRALPAQVDTLLNVLRFVDAVNSLIGQQQVRTRLRPEDGGVGALYDDLLAWHDGALQVCRLSEQAEKRTSHAPKSP